MKQAMSGNRKYYAKLARQMAELRSSQVDAPEAAAPDCKCPGLLGIFFTTMLAFVVGITLIKVLDFVLVGATAGILG